MRSKIPTYHYKCNKKTCAHEFEISHGIKEKPLRKCPKCAKLSLEKVLYACMGRVARTPLDMKSVGDLAKLNTDRLTKGEKEAKDHEYVESSKLAKQNIAKQSIEKPWYHNSNDPKDLTRKLAKATPKQKQKYIKDGQIPE